MNPTIIAVLVVAWVVVLVGTRMRKPAAVGEGGASVAATQDALARGKQERFGFMSRFLKGRKGSSKIDRDLVTAGIALKPTEFLMVNFVFMIVVILLGLVHINSMPAPNLFATIKKFLWLFFYVWFGFNMPRKILNFMASQRRGKLEYQLTDALTIVSSGLKGGYSFIQGVDMASQQLDAPIKDEFARVLRLVQLGLDTPRALLQMAERVNSYDFDMTVSATNIQLAVGGNLSQLLEGIAATIRDRIRLRRDIAALTAQGRMSGGILIALPIAIALMLRVVNYEYMSKLFTTDVGNGLIYLAAGQQFIGIMWIKKLLDFDN